MKRQKREHDKSHLDFIRSLPCCVCGDNTSTEAAHIRFGDRTVAKRTTGMGEKPHDLWTVPLCGKHHREQHQNGEREWWGERDPIRIALALWRVSGDYESGTQIAQQS